MNGDAPEERFDGPSVIVGRGRLGTALATMGMGEDVVLGRGEAIPATLAATSGRGESEGDGELMLYEQQSAFFSFSFRSMFSRDRLVAPAFLLKYIFQLEIAILKVSLVGLVLQAEGTEI